MEHTLFEHLRRTLELRLPDARAGKASAFAEISNAHETATHLDERFAIAYAWICLACDCDDATDTAKEKKLEHEILFDPGTLSEGVALKPVILGRIAEKKPPGRWTGTVVPNDEDFVREWLKFNETRHARCPSWPRGLLFEHIMRRDFEGSLAMLDALFAGCTTGWQLVMLGCGPLEDFINAFGKSAADALVPRALGEPGLAKAIASARISDPEIRAYWSRCIRDHRASADFPAEDGPHHRPGPAISP